MAHVFYYEVWCQGGCGHHIIDRTTRPPERETCPTCNAPVSWVGWPAPFGWLFPNEAVPSG